MRIKTKMKRYKVLEVNSIPTDISVNIYKYTSSLPVLAVFDLI